MMRWPWSKPATVTEPLFGKAHIFQGITPGGQPLVRVMQGDGSYRESVFDSGRWQLRATGKVVSADEADVSATGAE